MQIKPENGQHGSREALHSVTIETLGEFAAVAAGFEHEISTRFTVDHPGHLVTRKYAPVLGLLLPDAVYERVDDYVERRRERIIAADPELSFMQGILNEYAPFLVRRDAEFAARTYTGDEAVLVVGGLWNAARAINGDEAARSLVGFMDETA
jgi:hypothetical protein